MRQGVVGSSPEAGAADGTVPSGRHTAGVVGLDERILIVLSEFGYWGEELVGPLESSTRTGTSRLRDAQGQASARAAPEHDRRYFDPPLGKSVTDEDFAAKIREIDASPALDNPIDI